MNAALDPSAAPLKTPLRRRWAIAEYRRHIDSPQLHAFAYCAGGLLIVDLYVLAARSFTAPPNASLDWSALALAGFLQLLAFAIIGGYASYIAAPRHVVEENTRYPDKLMEVIHALPYLLTVVLTALSIHVLTQDWSCVPGAGQSHTATLSC